MTQDIPTPPTGVIGVQRARRPRPLQPARTPTPPSGLDGLPDDPRPTLHSRPGPALRYRVVSAEDPGAWSLPGQGNGLLDLPDAERPAAWERIADGLPLAVLCARAQLDQVRRESAVARSVVDIAVTVIPVPSGPLGRFVGARLADHLLAQPQDRTPATILAMLPALLAELPNLGVVRSVSSLEIGNIGLRHHLASYLPGGGPFVVQLTPRPGVLRMRGRRLTDRAGVIRQVDLGPGPASAAVHGSLPVPPAVLAALGVAGDPDPMPGAPDISRFWHAADATELVVLPGDPVAWAAARMPESGPEACNWCSEPLAGGLDWCLFCGNTRR
jgi:hypothetical protein